MTIEAPLRQYRDHVRPEWIDYNGHMNLAYYVLAFDHATDALFNDLGIGLDYMNASGCSTFAADMNVCYLRELHQGDPIACTTWFLGYDEKRLHYFHEMYHGTEGWLAASCELLSLHINMDQRRTTSFPSEIMARLAEVHAAHAALPAPERIGRPIRAPKTIATG